MITMLKSTHKRQGIYYDEYCTNLGHIYNTAVIKLMHSSKVTKRKNLTNN